MKVLRINLAVRTNIQIIAFCDALEIELSQPFSDADHWNT